MPIIGSTDVTPKSVQSVSTQPHATDKKQGTSVITNAKTPQWNLDSIVLDESTKQSVKDAIVFCNNRDKIVNEWNLTRFMKGEGGITGINMYGKPGTGKSITAEAIAEATGRKIIKADYSQIQDSKWGGTEKQLTEIFETAKKENAVIFFDEANGLLSKRRSEGANSETNNQIKSHLLTLLDDYNVIVVFATNLFKDYDRAFFRRILFHINFPTPGREQLISLWNFHFGDGSNGEKAVPRVEDFSMEKLADDSRGLTGGDIKNITLKVCTQLVAQNLPGISNKLVSNEIEKYKKSLQDMGENLSSDEGETIVLTGKDKEAADKLFEAKEHEETISGDDKELIDNNFNNN
ncbi:MAG: AAA family ATPase [Bacteroidales bacterium]|nr:AAA family ATPase [Bacteroidales bacterium]